jgi:hypothetical protein
MKFLAEFMAERGAGQSAHRGPYSACTRCMFLSVEASNDDDLRRRFIGLRGGPIRGVSEL